LVWEVSQSRSWTKKDLVKLCRYWYKEPFEITIVQFEDGSQGALSDYESGKLPIPKVLVSENEKSLIAIKSIQDNVQYNIPEYRDAEIVRQRIQKQYKVKWCLTNGYEILEEGEWHTSSFPFVAFVGKDTVVDGKRDIHGIIRNSKDAQRMLNYSASSYIRQLATMNKTPWIADARSIPEGPLKQQWERSNTDDIAILYYIGTDSKGQPINPPSRGTSMEPAVQAIMGAMAQFDMEIKNTIGIHDANIGVSPNEQSGIAIKTNAERGELSNLHFSDNFVMSMKTLGKLLVQLIPVIYDTPRTIRIIGADDQKDIVAINQIFTKNGKQMRYDIAGAPELDVVINTGPTFASKKSQELENMLQVLQTDPQLTPILIDLVVNRTDWSDKEEIRARS